MIATFLSGIISPASVLGLISLMSEDSPEDRMVGCAVLWYLRMINCILIQSVLLSNILFRYGSVDKIIVLVMCFSFGSVSLPHLRIFHAEISYVLSEQAIHIKEQKRALSLSFISVIFYLLCLPSKN